jgi:hypothetical protein
LTRPGAGVGQMPFLQSFVGFWGFNWGVPFLVGLGASFFLYFVGGLCFGWQTRKGRRESDAGFTGGTKVPRIVRSHPHYRHWGNIYGLVIDGIAFTVGCGCCVPRSEDSWASAASGAGITTRSWKAKGSTATTRLVAAKKQNPSATTKPPSAEQAQVEQYAQSWAASSGSPGDTRALHSNVAPHTGRIAAVGAQNAEAVGLPPSNMPGAWQMAGGGVTGLRSTGRLAGGLHGPVPSGDTGDAKALCLPGSHGRREGSERERYTNAEKSHHHRSERQSSHHHRSGRRSHDHRGKAKALPTLPRVQLPSISTLNPSPVE